MPERKKRYYLIDAIRGLTLVSMVIFHFSYDVFMTYGRDPHWYGRPEVHFWQQTICWTFILISGFVWELGKKKNLRRGIELTLFGIGISLVTWLIMPSEAVWFGVISFFGCAVLLMFPAERLVKRLAPALGLALSFLLFLLLRGVPEGFIGLGGLWRVRLPEALYSTRLLVPLGLPYPGFTSSDYFPLLPWFFLFLCGYFLRKLFLRSQVLQRAAETKIPFLSFVGSKTLWIYLLHQPLNMLICEMVFG